MPVDDDNTVHLLDLPDVLSLEERNTLLQQIPPVESLSEENLLRNFTIAKVFVHAAVHY